MSYRIEAASKEEWAERAFVAEKKLAVLEDSIKELEHQVWLLTHDVKFTDTINDC